MDLNGKDLVKALEWARKQGIMYESMRRSYMMASNDHIDAMDEIAKLKKEIAEIIGSKEGEDDE